MRVSGDDEQILGQEVLAFFSGVGFFFLKQKMNEKKAKIHNIKQYL